MKKIESKNIIELMDKSVTILGLALICLGTFKIYSPLGYITAGILLASPWQNIRPPDGRR